MERIRARAGVSNLNPFKNCDGKEDDFSGVNIQKCTFVCVLRGTID